MSSYGNYNKNCGNVTNSNNTIVNKTDEDSRIKEWLSQLTPQARHQSVQSERVEGVGGWILEKNEFRGWSSSQGVPKQAILFCYGDPGVGKTHMNSLVIDHLDEQVYDPNIAVAALYCDYVDQEKQSMTNILGAILTQLFASDGIREPVQQAFRRAKLGGRAAKLSDLMEMLKATIALLQRVFICIDALDECLPGIRLKLLQSLQEIVRASPTTRVFLTGRPHVQDEVKRYFPEAIMIPITPTLGDIETFLKMRLDEDPTPTAMDYKLRAEIMSVIPRKISQIFLLVSLNVNAVLEEPTILERKEKLDEMTQGNGLRGAYSSTLERIKAQSGSKPSLVMNTLMWLSHSERPLKTDELCDALGVKIGSVDRTSEGIPAIEILLGCSLGLVVVEASTYTVRLVHRTLQEYLCNNTHLFQSPHAVIAQTCLTYLNFQCIRALSHNPSQRRIETSLLEYASCYWGIHARRETTESVNELAVRLLDRFDEHVSSWILLSHNHDNWDGNPSRSNPTGFTGIHCVAYLGLAEAALGLLKMEKWDFGATDVGGNTAIMWAVKQGHEVMVKTLLERRDVSPNAADKHGVTPLHRAVIDGRAGIVKMLLEWEDVSPNTADKDGQTPLHRAVMSKRAVIGKRAGIVKMLLGRKDLIPGTTNKYGRTPLLCAVIDKRADIVKVLLEREDVSPNTTGKDGVTPLHQAVIDRSMDIVKMLLDREDLSPNTPDRCGQTTLSWAAGNGNGDAVRMLLGRRDITPDTEDKGGRTALSWAAGNGRRSIVNMLLELEDLTPDTEDKNGRTALSWAARNGHGGIVKILLDREDITPCTADKDGRTPLWWAARSGDEGVVKLLLEREDVTPDTTDKDGRTPLHEAAIGAHTVIAEMLLERGDITPYTADKGGRTALSLAAGNGHGRIVKMLLERGDVTPDTADKDGRTALSWAAGNGHGGIMKMLLERGDVTPDTTNKGGPTPLLWAVRYHLVDIVKILLARGDVSPNTADEDGRTSLSWAAGNGHAGIVKMLLEREDVTPGGADKDGRTPLSWAVVCGHGGVVKMLLEREDVTSDTPDKDGSTPLSWAAGSGNEDMVKILLERGGVAPDTPHKNGQTPLSWAAERGHIRVIEMLLERCNIRHGMLTTDPAGWAALTQASGEQLGRGIKRRFGDQDSLPLSNSSTSLVPTDPSESHDTLPKGSRDPDIHDKSSSPDEPPHLQYRHYAIALLTFALNSPLRALFLSSMWVWFLRILAIYLPILAYHIISFFYL